MRRLNKTETAVLRFLIEHKLECLDTPTVPEVAEAVGKSNESVTLALRRLRDFGYVIREANRTLRVLHYPNGAPFKPVLLEQVSRGHAYVIRGEMSDEDFEDLRATMWLAGSVVHRAIIE